MSKTVRTVLIWFTLIAALLFIFGPVFGLRETGQQTRSRLIQEDHERRMRRSEEELARAKHEMEETRRRGQRLWEEHERMQRELREGR